MRSTIEKKPPSVKCLRQQLFTAIIAIVGFAVALPLDHAVTSAVRQIPDGARAVFAGLSSLTDPSLLLPVMTCGFLVTGLLSLRWGSPAAFSRILGLALASSLLALVTVFLLKILIGRARPLTSLGFDPFLFNPLAGSQAFESLPSAQAAVTGAICHCVASGFPGNRRVALAVMAIVGLSRVVVERHWLSDVIAGWIIGWLVASLVTFLVQTRQKAHGHDV